MRTQEHIEFSCNCGKAYSLPIHTITFNVPFTCTCKRQILIPGECIGRTVTRPFQYADAIGRTTDELVAELERLDRERDRLARAIEQRRDSLQSLRRTA